jgi:hypothetical protein
MQIMLIVILPLIAVMIMMLHFEHRDEKATKKAEEDRVAALPPLDTSDMLLIPECEGDEPGTFGNRYCHMLVVDRDCRQYVCFMTDHNMRALWRSGFRQSGYSPRLVEGLSVKPVLVNGEEIDVYPWVLGQYPHQSTIWQKWAELHKGFDAWEAMGGNYHASFDRYFGSGGPKSKVSVA